MSTKKMVITSDNPIFKQKIENQHYSIEYGVLKKGVDSKVEILFEGCSFLSYVKSCQCTKPVVTPLENGFKVEVSYDTQKVGTINQFVKIKTTQEKEIKIDLKGQILR